MITLSGERGATRGRTKPRSSGDRGGTTDVRCRCASIRNGGHQRTMLQVQSWPGLHQGLPTIRKPIDCRRAKRRFATQRAPQGFRQSASINPGVRGLLLPRRTQRVRPFALSTLRAVGRSPDLVAQQLQPGATIEDQHPASPARMMKIVVSE